MSKRSFDSKPPREWPGVRVLRALWRTNAASREAHKAHFRGLPVQITEFDFLAALGNTRGLRMRDLAHAMITTPSNVTRVCAEMEKRGLAVRERSPDSDREVIARLTPAGQQMFEELFMPTARFTQATIDQVLTEDEQRQLATLLERLLAAWRTPAEPPDQPAA